MSSGFVYLLHFSSPICPGRHTCQHYVGFAKDLPHRIQQHRAGSGARLTEVAAERGITFTVARVWRGNRTLERAIKNRKNAPHLCPICAKTRAGLFASELSPEEIEEALIAF